MAVLHSTVVATADDGTSPVGTAEWNAAHTIDVGGVPFASRTDNTDPAAPAADTILMYAKTIAGRVMPKWIGPSGVDMIIQPHLGTNNCRMIYPGSGTTVGAFPSNVATIGIASVQMSITTALISTGGTLAQATIASTNLLTQTKRVVMNSGATNASGIYTAGITTECWRGNAAGLGGFFFTARFGFSVVGTTGRFFIGLRDVVTAPTNVDYNIAATTTPGRIGVSKVGAGNLFLNYCVSGTAPTATDLGANFANNVAHMYELMLFAKPNDTLVYYRVTNLSTGNYVTNSISTNIPATTTFLSPVATVTNGSAAASAIDLVKMYLETDF